MTIERLRPNWKEVRPEYWAELFKKSPRDQLATSLDLPVVGTKLSDDAAMFLACAVALRGAGNVSPNPLVGAVLLDSDTGYLSSGAHLRAGDPHAEVQAIKALPQGRDMSGGSLFVTLEPCAHHGRTPPCADMIAKSSIARVVFGLEDPNPKVNGAGELKIKQSAKLVEKSIRWRSSCEWLARVFLINQRSSRIFTAMKVASTPSGTIAGEQTSRLWITNERSRQMGHFLRLEYDAICIGANTAILDDPTLDVRIPGLDGRMPFRIVVDDQERLAHCERKLKLLNETPDRTLAVIPESASRALENKFGIETLRLPRDVQGNFAWKDIQGHLWGLGLRSLLLEGGATLYRSACDQSAVDALHWFVAQRELTQGLKWPVNTEALAVYKNGGGVPLEGDRLVELELGPMKGGPGV